MRGTRDSGLGTRDSGLGTRDSARSINLRHSGAARSAEPGIHFDVPLRAHGSRPPPGWRAERFGMAFLELSLTLSAEQQPLAEAALEESGALSVTLLDADAETPDERAIFEPGVGETPLWKALMLNALFDSDA